MAIGQFADQLVSHHGGQRSAEHRCRTTAASMAELAIAPDQWIQGRDVLNKQTQSSGLLQQAAAEQCIKGDLQLGRLRG